MLRPQHFFPDGQGPLVVGEIIFLVGIDEREIDVGLVAELGDAVGAGH